MVYYMDVGTRYGLYDVFSWKQSLPIALGAEWSQFFVFWGIGMAT